MFDHIGFEVRELKASQKFYEKALAPLGIKVLLELPQWKSVGFGGEDRQPRFWLGEGEPKNGPDEVHLCFAARDRAQVNAFHEAAIAAGGKDNGKPGLRPEYHAHYYGAFVLDPDGHNIEACCHKPE